MQESHAVAVGRRLGPYELIRQVGSGGMGIVFEAHDHERHTTVALKTLHRLDPMALLRLKSEFRSMADVLHPNLVQLHELRSIDGIWFFTMEYVDGESFASLLQRAAAKASGFDSHVAMNTATAASPLPALGLERGLLAEPTATSTPDNAAPLSPPPATVLLPATSPTLGPLLDMAQVHHFFGQLAQAICALHQAGKLHCDIKPANIMVARDGRVVLLDFGLVSDSTDHPVENLLVGTPSYMAPERAEGHPASEACDWYALGTMLYEVLAGHRPFPASIRLPDKARLEVPPLPPSSLIPQEMRELCMMLLSRNPDARPSGPQVLKRLQGSGRSASQEGATRTAPTLVGREQHLTALHDALRAVSAGKPVTVHVYGHSGMGKSALVQHFLEKVQQQGPVLVLRGRCYERESVPYKGMDDLVDCLTRHLSTLPPKKAQAFCPEDMGALVRVFPVLRQVGWQSEQPPPTPPTDSRDMQEVRRRAFQALKVLLSRLARSTPLILQIDDLQWGDEDSSTLLHELLSPPEAPPLLLVCGFRSEQSGASSFFAEHRRMKELLGDHIDIREVEVGPLSPPEATQLASRLLGSMEGAEALARECQGSPFFLEELARRILGTHSTGSLETATRALVASLEHLVLERVAQLPEEARRVLEVVSVAGHSLPQGIATAAAAVQGNSLGLWTLLRTRSLVRTHGTRETDGVECYHDRIRETVYASLPAETLRLHHLRLAERYEASGTADPEVLAQHYLGAGVHERAGHYLTLAADRASSKLAFERAAKLYHSALECRPEQQLLLLKEADALVNAGRCAEAAPLYLRAAQQAEETASFELKLRAAEQYLQSGCLDEGLAVFRPLLEQSELHYPATPRRALLGLLGRNLRLRLRGFGFRERPESALSHEKLRRIDLLWAAAKGLGSLDVIRGAYFIVSGMLLALEQGEPRRVYQGLVHTSFTLASPGTPSAVALAYRHLRATERFARQSADPYLLGFMKATSATVNALVGRWQQTLLDHEEAANILGQCPGTAWELSVARSSASTALRWRGDLHTLAVQGTAWLRHIEENGDRYGSVWLRQHLSSVLLASDDHVAAERLISESLKDMSERIFTLPHLNGVFEACDVDMYRGDAASAWRRITQVWKRAEESFTLQWQLARVRGLFIRGMAAVAFARDQQPSEHKRLLAHADKDASRLERLGRPHALGAAALLRSRVAAARGRTEQALAELDLATARYEEADMRLALAGTFRCKGELVGGDEGRALVAHSEAIMRTQGIRRPERWAAIYSLGLGS